MSASMGLKVLLRPRLLSAIGKENCLLYPCHHVHCKYASSKAFLKRKAKVVSGAPKISTAIFNPHPAKGNICYLPYTESVAPGPGSTKILKSVIALNSNSRLKLNVTSVVQKCASGGPKISAKLLQLQPTHSIYEAENFAPQKYSLHECITMHKESAQPAMMNTMNSQIYADMKLNLSTKKKTKFMNNIRGILQFPHMFEHSQTKQILLFSDNEEECKAAEEAGIHMSGGQELIQLFISGAMPKSVLDEYDFVFVTPSLMKAVTPLRAMLREKHPSVKNGCVVVNVVETLELYKAGVKYISYKPTQETGHVQIPFGQLIQSDSQLEENFNMMIEKLNGEKPPNTAPLVEEVSIIAPPSAERFDLQTRKTTAEPEQSKEEDSDAEDEDTVNMKKKARS